jgi:predicted nuclease of predicted toxin-antitoxin system
MRFLADVGISASTVARLRDRLHDVVHLAEGGLERMTDSEILCKARAEQRIVLTFDLDFDELMAASRHSLPSVVTFRLRNQRPENVIWHLDRLLLELGNRLAESVIVTVEERGYRLRRLPISGGQDEP